MRSQVSAPGGHDYVAFLRGINVGGHAAIGMDELGRAFEAHGFGPVKTFLASGNVLFHAAAEDPAVVAREVAKALRDAFGRDVAVDVRRREDLRPLAARFRGVATGPGDRLFVTFISGNASREAASNLPDGKNFRIIGVEDGMICSILYGRPGASAVELMKAMEKEFGQKATTRSWNTVSRLI